MDLILWRHAEARERADELVDGSDEDMGRPLTGKGEKTLREGGYISAANASQICDGASGVMVVNERGLKALLAKPLARVHHMTVLGGDPVIMLEEPLPATTLALQRAGLLVDRRDQRLPQDLQLDRVERAAGLLGDAHDSLLHSGCVSTSAVPPRMC